MGVPKTGAGGPPLASPPHVSSVTTLTQKENEFSAPKQICLDFSGLRVQKLAQLLGGVMGTVKPRRSSAPGKSRPRPRSRRQSTSPMEAKALAAWEAAISECRERLLAEMEAKGTAVPPLAATTTSLLS